MDTPANPTLYRKKWGLQGYSLFPYFCYKNCGYSFKPPQRGGYWGVSNVYPQLMISGEIKKVSNFFLWKSSSAKCNVFEHVFFYMFSLWGKSGVCWGVHYFLITAPKHRLWVLVRTDTPPRRFERVPIDQTWGIRSNTSQMWTVWPNSTNLSHIQQNTSHVKNPTEFLTPIFADNVLCKIFDRLCQTWEIQWYTTRLWKNRPNSYKLWLIGQKTSHVKNATEFLTPLFTERVSPVWHLTKYSTLDLSNSIEFFTAVKNFHQIRHSHDIFDRIHHMWKIRPNFSHLYSPKISHVKYPTEYIKRGEFDRIRHRCEQLDLIRHSYDIFDRIHHMWKIRPNFSHLYSPIRPHVRYLTDYIKREKLNDILQRCGKIDRIHTSCDILDRKHHMWKIRPNFSHLYSPKI